MNLTTASRVMYQVDRRIAACLDLTTCEYGHFDCSYIDGGPCSNEAWGIARVCAICGEEISGDRAEIVIDGEHRPAHPDCAIDQGIA